MMTFKDLKKLVELLFYGNTIIPFKDKFDTSLKLYGLMTTKPNEIAKYREKKDA